MNSFRSWCIPPLWLGSANDNNNVWNVNSNGNFDNNNFDNDNNYGVRPAFHQTEDYVSSVYNEKRWKTSIIPSIK